MVTEAKPYLPDGHRSWDNGVCEDAVDVPAHVLSCLLVQFLETKVSQSEAKVRLLPTEVTVKVSTNDGGPLWIQNLFQLIIKGSVVLTPVDVDDIHLIPRNFCHLQIILSHIS